MSVLGVLLPCGTGVEPTPIFVGDYTDIQDKVGGLFDAVTAILGDDNDAVVVGYINDDSAFNGSDMNFLATSLFRRELYGDCVVVWGLDENGVYDGDNHDLPDSVVHWMCTKLLERTAEAYNESIMLNEMLVEAVRRGLTTKEEVNTVKEQLYNGVSYGDIECVKDGEEKMMNILNRLSSSMSVNDMLDLLYGKLVGEDSEDGSDA
jgi:hypothetical protein